VYFTWQEDGVEAVSVDIYNISGNRIAHLQESSPQNRRLVWDAGEIAPGIYLYRVSLTRNGAVTKSEFKKVAIIQ